jgi:hypothetical protein
LADEYTVDQIDLGSILIGTSTVPSSISVLASHPDFVGEVLEIIFDLRSLVSGYGFLWDTTFQTVAVSGNLLEGGGFLATTELLLIGHRSGDVNADGAVNIVDVQYLIRYLMAGGDEPLPYAAGDADCSGAVNISDAVYLIQYIFGGGPAPSSDCW